MSTELAIRGGALAVADDQTSWSDQQLAVLRSVGVSEDVLPAELDQFLHECQRTGLDPFSRQIYLIGRYDKQAGRDVFRSQTGIDGYRVVAHRAAKRDHTTIAYSETLWCGPDKVWCDVWLEDWPPRAAKITVFRGGEPFPATATLAEYAATYKNGDPTPMWRRMPATMLAKCAEAKALRMAFPHDLGGIYTAEEMEQADNSRREGPAQRHRGPVQDEWNTVPGQVIAAQQDRDAEASQETPEYAQVVEDRPPAADPGQVASILAALQARGINDRDQARNLISTLAGRQIGAPVDLTAAEADRVLERLTAPVEQQPEIQPEPAPSEEPRQYKMRMMFALIKEKGHTKDGAYALASKVFKRDITSAKELSSDEVDAFIELLKTGELPPNAATPEPAPPSGPDPLGEGISEFDALDQMILDVTSDEARDEVEQAITVELGRGTITATGAGVLRRRLAEHVEQAKASAR